MAVSVNAVANVMCEGAVTYLGMGSNGSLNVSVNNYGVWAICNLTMTFNGNGGQTFTPETCRAWYAAILAAQKSGTSVMFYFATSASSANGPECTALGSWVVPDPSPYFMLAR
jgi:hypothetical protein